MANPELVRRMKDCLSRQIALYDAMLAEHRTLNDDLGKEDLSVRIERQGKYAREIKAIERESHILQREWREAANLSDRERAAVGVLTEEAQDRVTRLSDLNARAIDSVRNRQAEVKKEWDALRRRIGAVGKYRPGGQDDAGFVDKKA